MGGGVMYVGARWAYGREMQRQTATNEKLGLVLQRLTDQTWDFYRSALGHAAQRRACKWFELRILTLASTRLEGKLSRLVV